MLTRPRSEWSRALLQRLTKLEAGQLSLGRIAGYGAMVASAMFGQSAQAQAPYAQQYAQAPVQYAQPQVPQTHAQPLPPAVQQVQHMDAAIGDARIQAMPIGQQKLELVTRRSQLIVTRDRVRRIHISDPSILEVVQFTEKEFSLIGQTLGVADLTFWFEGSDEPLMYEVTTIPDPALEEQRRIDYGKIEQKLALLYPNSKVYLIPMSQKIIVRGQAKDAEEAARIMQIVRGEVLTQEGSIFGGYAGNRGRNGFAVEPTGGGGGGFGGGFGGGGNTGFGDLLSSFIVNELQVPGEFQIKIRVRIADINRSQLRRLGVDWTVAFNDARHIVSSGLSGAAGALGGIFENGDVTVMLDALASNGSAKILEDAVLVTMSGNPASFLSGGEFAVPNTVGNNGILVGTTTFRGFGTSIIATPTVIDDDLIRLQIVPELSAINGGNSVGGVPGVDVRRVQTMVELREGQTMVLGGLFSRRQQAEVTRIPLLGEIPILGTYLFNTKQATEDETELLIIVTPEIVRPMDPDEVPPMPGFYVTHPDDFDFYKFNRTEGNPDLSHYRLLPYGNGSGYGENVGFGFHNPDHSNRYCDPGMTGVGDRAGAGYGGIGMPMQGQGQPMGSGYVPQQSSPQGNGYQGGGYSGGQQMMQYQQPMVTPGFEQQPAPVIGVSAIAQPQQGTIQQTSGQTQPKVSLLSPASWFRKKPTEND